MFLLRCNHNLRFSGEQSKLLSSSHDKESNVVHSPDSNNLPAGNRVLPSPDGYAVKPFSYYLPLTNKYAEKDGDRLRGYCELKFAIPS